MAPSYNAEPLNGEQEDISKDKKSNKSSQYCVFFPPNTFIGIIAIQITEYIFQLIYFKQDNHQQREVG